MWPFLSGLFHLLCSHVLMFRVHMCCNMYQYFILHTFIYLELSNGPFCGYTMFAYPLKNLCTFVSTFIKIIPYDALNIHVKVFVQTFVFNSLEVELHMATLFDVWRNCKTFLPAPFYISINHVRGPGIGFSIAAVTNYHKFTIIR